MEISRRSVLKTAGATAAAALGGAHVRAEQPAVVRIVSPYGAGGSADTAARALAEGLHRQTGRSFVVDQRTGAGGRIAVGIVRAAPPDGRSLLINVASGFTVVPHSAKEEKDRELTDMKPVSAVTKLDCVFYVNPSVPANNLSEFIALAKADPRGILFGTSGAGNLTHMYGLMLAGATNITLKDVPYTGGAPAMLAVMAGHAPAAVGSVYGSLVQAHNDKRIRILAVMGSRRNPFLPDVPTTVEAGVPQISISDWIGLFAPPSTPAALVNALHKDVAEVTKDPIYLATLKAAMLEPLSAGPTECAAMLRKEFSTWQPIVRASGYTST